MNRPPSPKRIGTIRRREVSAAAEERVREAAPVTGSALPAVFEPTLEGVDLVAWVAENRPLLDARLAAQGGVLFRGFDFDAVAELQAFVEAASDRLMGYEDRTSPRSQVKDMVFTSTEHPADQPILLHNENSYSFSWPGRIFFSCVTPAGNGGATPLADSRKVADRLSPAVRERFRERGVMYVRNFGENLGLPWQEVFQTREREQVEAFCRANRIEVEWKEGDRLRATQVRPGLIRHPKSGEEVWFNQILLFHPAGLEPEVRRELLQAFAEDELPSSTYYGDGSPIEEETLDEIRTALEAETLSFPWRKGDVLALDNMLVAHGRAPYRGPRKIVVAMADAVSLEDLGL